MLNKNYNKTKKKTIKIFCWEDKKKKKKKEEGLINKQCVVLVNNKEMAIWMRMNISGISPPLSSVTCLSVSHFHFSLSGSDSYSVSV